MAYKNVNFKPITGEEEWLKGTGGAMAGNRYVVNPLGIAGTKINPRPSNKHNTIGGTVSDKSSDVGNSTTTGAGETVNNGYVLPNYATYNYFNPYASAGSTNLAYYKNLASNVENNLNKLFSAKYGANGYNLNSGWFQDGQVVDGWDKNAENQGYAQYQKLMADLQNINNMIAKYQSIETDRQQQTARLGIQQDLIEKYMQEDRRIRGIENSGQAETSTNAILNAYINAENQIRQNAENNLHAQEMAFQNAQYEGMNNFENYMYELQNSSNVDNSDLKELIAYASTKEEFDMLEQTFGDEIASDKTLQYLFQSGKTSLEKQIKKEEEYNRVAIALKETYGLTDDEINGAISAKELSMNSFDGFGGAQTGNEQKDYLEKIKVLALAGEIPDGTVVEMDYGRGEKGYMYYQGKFYPTTKPITSGWRSVWWQGQSSDGVYKKYEKYMEKYNK